MRSMMSEDSAQIVKIDYDNGRYLGQYVIWEGVPMEHGFGLFSWSNGDRYEGEYNMGVRSGKGTFTWFNGNQYDQRTGKGTMTWSDGTIIPGIS